MINSQMPVFRLNAYHKGKGFVTIDSNDLKGKWVVLFFYPADFTFVCPTELADMSDHYEAFKKMGVEVISISTDTHFVHKAWADATETINQITYPMMADPCGKLCRELGVMIEEEGVALRGTFLFNPEGQLKVMEVHDNGIGRDAGELLRKVEAAQFVHDNPGDVCPAKWRAGKPTLKPGIELVGKI